MSEEGRDELTPSPPSGPPQGAGGAGGGPGAGQAGGFAGAGLGGAASARDDGAAARLASAGRSLSSTERKARLLAGANDCAYLALRVVPRLSAMLAAR